MKETKFFNNISQELRDEIDKARPKYGETVTFQMLNGIPNPDPDDRERYKNPILYGKMQLRTNFTILDPYSKKYVQVGCVDQWNPNNPDYPERFRCFVPGQNDGSRFQGKFNLRGGKMEDDELFGLLYISPQREGSPCKDPSVRPLFRILDVKAESKVATRKYDILKKALDLAENMKVPKAREIMAALNQPTYQDEEVLISKAKELARTNPEQFIQTYEAPDTPLKYTLRESIDKGILDYDMSTGKIKLGNIVLTTLKLETSQSFIPEFARWINSAENGKDVLANIQNRLKQVEEVNQTE